MHLVHLVVLGYMEMASGKQDSHYLGEATGDVLPVVQ
jgi:hypothetical protein